MGATLVVFRVVSCCFKCASNQQNVTMLFFVVVDVRCEFLYYRGCVPSGTACRALSGCRAKCRPVCACAKLFVKWITWILLRLIWLPYCYRITVYITTTTSHVYGACRSVYQVTCTAHAGQYIKSRVPRMPVSTSRPPPSILISGIYFDWCWLLQPMGTRTHQLVAGLWAVRGMGLEFIPG